VNASSDAAMRAYLLKYDSLHGRFDGEVKVVGDDLVVNGKEVTVLRIPKPGDCPWNELKVDVVVESSGHFRSRENVEPHLRAGAQCCILTAPPKDDIPIIVPGVNDDTLKKAGPIVSAASCTTNCVAPILKILDEGLGVRRGLVCTTHAYTTSQNLLDNKSDSSKIRIARAAALSIVPSTTGAVKACVSLFPHLAGKIDGMALRVPVPTVSAAYLALQVKRKTTVREVNALFHRASKTTLKGILGFEEELLVSRDFTTDPRSSIVDADSTAVIDDTLVQILAWYDNEWGYAMRVTELVVKVKEMIAHNSVRSL